MKLVILYNNLDKIKGNNIKSLSIYLPTYNNNNNPRPLFNVTLPTIQFNSSW